MERIRWGTEAEVGRKVPLLVLIRSSAALPFTPATVGRYICIKAMAINMNNHTRLTHLICLNR